MASKKLKKVLKEMHRFFIKRRIKFIKNRVDWVIVLYAKLTYKLYKRSGVIATGRKTPVIVSLTSFGPRLPTTYLAIHTLLCQKVKPDRVILWLAHGEKVPESLTKLCQRGLEIKFCDDLKSYKKIIPALKAYPNDILVIADDDIVYNSRWLEKLYNCYLSDPTAIWAQKVYPARLAGSKKLIPFSEMLQCYKHGGKYDFLFLITGPGLLIPPHSLPEQVLEVETFQSLCYSCDDTWITAMSILKGTKCKMVQQINKNIITVPNSQEVSLWAVNKQRQDDIIHAVFTHFNLYERL